MGIFDKMFGGGENESNNQSKVNWRPLTDISEVEVAEMESQQQLVAILKHSTRCGISRMVLRQFENSYDIPEDAEVKLYFLDLLSHRDISNEIADRFKVRHESPQLIILQQKEVVHHSSHQDIDVNNIKEFL
ncbi:bacillithiol system redox-active protein YtxJ [Zunongwangia sp. SCSIO 43204]|uniref:bacillithiol system redox-active protein YtxJ n=1 Tax=Zunongwangia sp. SCSIO 43204 TaxID=2779359 RepID=UPI001CA82C32|nr:bacillithiol system redox-active protein YtxJ [Zunongwangia sp. SCSIO 43204]UAB84035.1 bacillithiol system redox-active protein YtxJ [Zunongwangia sp. SCSIO 43204]